MPRTRVLALFVGVGIVGQTLLALTLLQRFAGGLVLAPVLVLAWLTTASLLRRFRDDLPRASWARLTELAVLTYWAACVLALPGVALATLVYFGGGLPARTQLPHTWEWTFLGALGLAVWGVWGCRRWVRVTRLVLEWPELPAPFDGYVIAHLTDLHVGSTDPEAEVARWVSLTNRQRPDIVCVTGDLVTGGTHFYEKVCQALAGLRAPDGVCVVLGNHDLDAPERFEAELGARGIELLRNSMRRLTRGGAELVVVGLDPMRLDDGVVEEVLQAVPASEFTVLLSHYPQAFEVASVRGVKLVLSGHTHGGQVGMPWLGDSINFARLTGQRSRGLVEHHAAKLFVSAGLGTTGLPIRLGVRPEIALLELRSRPQVVQS